MCWAPGAAVLLWAISACVGMLQTWIYAETASMFPDKPGGISLYAHEGWRGRFSLAGPIGAFGYWIGWSVVLSIFGVVIGGLIQAQWFPTATWSVFDGAVHLGLPQFVAVGCIVGGLAAQRLRHPPGGVDLLRHRGRAAGHAGHLHLRCRISRATGTAPT